jgi:hypothetical protein
MRMDWRTDVQTDGPNTTFRNFTNETKIDLNGLWREIRLMWLRIEASGGLLWTMYKE